MNTVRGFTLVEMLFTLVIMLLVIAFALPATTRSLADYQLHQNARQLHLAFHQARTHAIFHRVPTLVCASRDGMNCSSSAGDWHNGWLVFADPDANGNCSLDPGNGICGESGLPLIISHRITDEQVQIAANRNVARQVRFGPMGLTEGFTGRLTLCHASQHVQGRGLVVPRSGRIRVASQQELLPC